jgi:hypothetical protein
VYREYWKRRIEEQLAAYQLFSRRQDMLDSFKDILKGAELKTLNNAAINTGGAAINAPGAAESSPGGQPLPGAFALAFLRTFHAAAFMGDMDKLLRPIVDEGKFFKTENRVEFAEAFGDMVKLEDDIREFEAKLAPSGEYGKRYTMAEQDMLSLAVKRRKIRMVADDAASEAAGIIGGARRAAGALAGILMGILKKESGGAYDSLSNLSDFTEKDPAFAAKVGDSIRKFQKVLQLLDKIDKMESGSN